jgi:hypothetical protein
VNIGSSTTAKLFFLPCLCRKFYTPLVLPTPSKCALNTDLETAT